MKWTMYIDDTLPDVTFYPTIEEALAAQDEYTRELYVRARDYAAERGLLKVTLDMGHLPPDEAERAYKAIRNLTRVETRRAQWDTPEGPREARGPLLSIGIASSVDGVPESVSVHVWELYPDTEWIDV